VKREVTERPARGLETMITVGFEVVPLHKKHKQGIELFVLIYDAQQVAGVLLGKDLTDNERGEARAPRSVRLGIHAPTVHI